MASDVPGRGVQQSEIRGPLKYIVRSAHKWGGNGRIPKFDKIKRVLMTRHPEVIAKGFGGDPNRAAAWLKDAWYKYWGISVKGKHGAGPTYWRGKDKKTRVPGSTRAKMNMSVDEQLLASMIEEHTLAPEGFFEGVDAELWLESSVATKRDGLVWLEATRTGVWEKNPVAGASGPLKINLELLTEIKRNFDEGAWEHVTVPLEHPRSAVEELIRNTGSVKQLKIVQDPQHAGEHIMLAGVEFTEPEAEGRVLRGTIPGRSIGVSLSGVTRHKDGKRFKNVLKHLALTAKPVIDGLKVGEADPTAYQELLASISYELSDLSDEIADRDDDDELPITSEFEDSLQQMLDAEGIEVDDIEQPEDDDDDDDESIDLSDDFAAVWEEDGRKFHKLPYLVNGKLNKRAVRSSLLLFSKTRMPDDARAEAALTLSHAAAALELKPELCASVDEYLHETMGLSYSDMPLQDRPRISGFGGGESDLEFPASVHHREAETLARSCASCEYYYEGDVCGRFGLATEADDVCDDLQQVGVTVNFSKPGTVLRVRKPETVLQLSVKQWTPDRHPRWPKNSPGGKGGEFMETADILDRLSKMISGIMDLSHLAKGSSIRRVELERGNNGMITVTLRGGPNRDSLGQIHYGMRQGEWDSFTLGRLLSDIERWNQGKGLRHDSEIPTGEGDKPALSYVVRDLRNGHETPFASRREAIAYAQSTPNRRNLAVIGKDEDYADVEDASRMPESQRKALERRASRVARERNKKNREEAKKARDKAWVDSFKGDAALPNAKSSGKTLNDFNVGDVVMLGGRDHKTPREQKKMAEGWALLHGPHEIIGKTEGGQIRVRHLESGHEYSRLPINSATLIPNDVTEAFRLPEKRKAIGTGKTDFEAFGGKGRQKRIEGRTKAGTPQAAVHAVQTPRGVLRVRPNLGDAAREPEPKEMRELRKEIAKLRRTGTPEDDKNLKRLVNKLRRMTAPERGPVPEFTRAQKERDLEKGNEIIKKRLADEGPRPPRSIKMPWTPQGQDHLVKSVYLHEVIEGTRSRFFARVSLRNGTEVDVDIPSDKLNKGGDYVRDRMAQLRDRKNRVAEAALENLNPEFADVDDATLRKWLKFWQRKGNDAETLKLNKELAARKAAERIEGPFGMQRVRNKLNEGRVESAKANLDPSLKSADDATIEGWLKYWQRGGKNKPEAEDEVAKLQAELENRRIIRNTEGDDALGQALTDAGKA